MSAITEITRNEFAWEIQPAAARWVRSALDTLAAFNPNIGRLADVLLDFTGTRLVDWLDHLALDAEALPELVGQLVDVGYVPDTLDSAVWRHPLGMFPNVLTDIGAIGVALRCESVEQALVPLPAALGLRPVDAGQVIGEGGNFRMVSIDSHVAG